MVCTVRNELFLNGRIIFGRDHPLANDGTETYSNTNENDRGLSSEKSKRFRT